ncbi:MAG: hypothetical protein H0T48_15965 [Gemmatimonadaceae bacterium]|nr:hypothetical protein [Gemmatimonadaceae bacterium]
MAEIRIEEKKRRGMPLVLLLLLVVLAAAGIWMWSQRSTPGDAGTGGTTSGVVAEPAASPTTP